MWCANGVPVALRRLTAKEMVGTPLEKSGCRRLTARDSSTANRLAGVAPQERTRSISSCSDTRMWMTSRSSSRSGTTASVNRLSALGLSGTG